MYRGHVQRTCTEKVYRESVQIKCTDDVQMQCKPTEEVYKGGGDHLHVNELAHCCNPMLTIHLITAVSNMSSNCLPCGEEFLLLVLSMLVFFSCARLSNYLQHDENIFRSLLT